MGSFLLLKLLDHLGPNGKNDFSDIAQYLVLKVSDTFIRPLIFRVSFRPCPT